MVNPLIDDEVELLRGHVRMPGGHDISINAGVAARKRGLQIAREDGFERLFFLPLRVLRSEFLDPVDREMNLEIQGLLGPEGAVVVERGDAFGGRHKIR